MANHELKSLKIDNRSLFSGYFALGKRHLSSIHEAKNPLISYWRQSVYTEHSQAISSRKRGFFASFLF